MFSARVIRIAARTPTIKKFTLEVASPEFRYRAGQWLDLDIPQIDTVGGFSFSSAPSNLPAARQIEFCVKQSRHPPARWMHEHCKPGDTLRLRAGGDCCLDAEESRRPCLFVAGGIGISPLWSMVQEMVVLNAEAVASVCYSAGSADELLFRQEMETLASSHQGRIGLQTWVTREPAPEHARQGRITRADLQGEVDRLGKSDVLAFVCGPPEMIDSVAAQLAQIGLAAEQIRYERWW